MNLEPWLIVVIIGLVGALLRHMQVDARRDQRLRHVEAVLKPRRGSVLPRRGTNHYR